MYRFPCPKCSSKTTTFYESDSRWSTPYPLNVEFSCYTCGFKRIGQPAVDLAELALAGKAKYEKELERKRKAAEIERRRLAEVARERAREQKRKEEEALARLEKKRARDREYRRKLRAERAVSDECFWVECSNKAGPTSKYCSRACSNKNSRARAKARKAAKVN